jgi:hypothetical protein
MKVVVAVLGMVLTWQARGTTTRIDRLDVQVRTLERNEIKILTTLGVTPCALDTLDFGVNSRVFTPLGGNLGNQKKQKRGMEWRFYPGKVDVIMVDSWSAYYGDRHLD